MSMAKEKDNGEYFWATEMWHQRLLNYDEKPGPLARLFTEKAWAKPNAEVALEEDTDGYYEKHKYLLRNYFTEVNALL